MGRQGAKEKLERGEIGLLAEMFRLARKDMEAGDIPALLWWGSLDCAYWLGLAGYDVVAVLEARGWRERAEKALATMDLPPDERLLLERGVARLTLPERGEPLGAA